jgi:repressor LexA
MRCSSGAGALDVVRGGIYPVGDEHTFVPTLETTMLETPLLTARQQEILQFLNRYVDEHGYPPTVREIGDAVGLASPSTVHAHLANLERLGLLRRDPTKPRAIELVGRRPAAAAASPEPAGAALLPLVGQIAAGGPLLAEENVEERVAVPDLVGSKADFLLRVTGDSMIEAGILDGDLVVVRHQDDARDGEIVVALVGEDESADEATVKTFRRDPGGRVRLQPENSALEPIYADHVKILGKVVGVLRSLT